MDRSIKRVLLKKGQLTTEKRLSESVHHTEKTGIRLLDKRGGGDMVGGEESGKIVLGKEVRELNTLCGSELGVRGKLARRREGGSRTSSHKRMREEDRNNKRKTKGG